MFTDGNSILFHNVDLSSQKPVQDFWNATRRGEYIHKKLQFQKLKLWSSGIYKTQPQNLSKQMQFSIFFLVFFNSLQFHNIFMFTETRSQELWNAAHRGEHLQELQLQFNLNSDHLKFTTNSSTDCPSRCLNLAFFLVLFGSFQWSSCINYKLP